MIAVSQNYDTTSIDEQLDQATSTTALVTTPGNQYAGKKVEIIGTGKLGLCIRIEPGLDSFYLTMAKEGEIFTIIDGPIELDGYDCWQVQSEEDAEITGWCAGEYLKRK